MNRSVIPISMWAWPDVRSGRAVVRALDVAACLAIAVVCLLAVRLPSVLSPVAAGPLGRWIRRAPTLAALTAMATGVVVCVVPWSGGPAGLVLRGAAGYLALGVFRGAAIAAQETPAAFAAIQARAETGLVERWFYRRLEHPIDAFFLGIAGSAAVMGVIPAILVIAVPAFTWMGLGFIWIAGVVLNTRHYTMLHVNSHNPIFRLSRASRARSATDRAIVAAVAWFHEYIVNPTIDVMPEFVRAMHIYNHHVEQNSLDDVTTTLPYDRASLFSFCRLAVRRGLLVGCPVVLVHYLVRRGRRRELTRLVRGAVFFYAGVAALWFAHPALGNFLLAAVFVRGVAIGGPNAITEHPFVDLAEPLNPYRNAMLVVEDDTDHGWYGEWLHAEHHARPGRHWAAVAAAGRAELPRYRAEGAIGMRAFRRRAFLQALWTQRFERLSEYVLWIGPRELSRDQVAAILESRTRAVGGRRPDVGSRRRRLDLALGAAVAWLVTEDSADPAG